MSYQVLARKWRPQTFTDIVGQEHVVTALVNALKAKRLHHAYLFSGTRGVGKTTVARVLAKALTCEQGITAEPCGVCESCVAITEGRFVDLIEVDAASRTKVEDTRELLENVQYAPTRGRFKIYLIDEVHMLSGHSFNALLKTLEEPPEHVKFLLATTDPQKLPVTVLSRCLQFTLRHISVEQITEQLQRVLQQEQITADIQTLIPLADAADGSMRDALSLLDQAIAYSGGNLSEQAVTQMLGTVPGEQVDALVTAIVEQNAPQAMEIVQSLSTLNVDFGKLMDQLSTIFHSAAIAQVVPEYIDNVFQFSKTIDRVKGLMSAEDLQLFYQIMLNGRKDLYLANSGRAGFEMAVLRMIMFRPLEQAKTPHPKTVRKAIEQQLQQQAGQAPKVEKKPTQVSEASNCEDWQSIIDKMQLNGVSRILATHCCLHSFQDNHFKLGLAKEHESLTAGTGVEKLTQALKTLYGDDVIVTIDLSNEGIDSPAQRDQDDKAKQISMAEDNLKGDSFVRTLEQGGQAEIVPGSIQPIDK